MGVLRDVHIHLVLYLSDDLIVLLYDEMVFFFDDGDFVLDHYFI